MDLVFSYLDELMEKHENSRLQTPRKERKLKRLRTLNLSPYPISFISIILFIRE